jgi:hypothetical protein
VQATTHFAAPLVVINGRDSPGTGVRLGAQLVFERCACQQHAWTSAATDLINIGGARPGEIDMSALRKSGKFSFVIAENEEESPWEPFVSGSAITVSPATLRTDSANTPRAPLQRYCAHSARCSRPVWSPRVCGGPEALVVISPEHAKTLARDGFSKAHVREWLWNNTGVPVSNTMATAAKARNSLDVSAHRDSRCAVLPEIQRSVADSDYRCGWHGGQVFRGARELGDRRARQPSGNVSD